MGPSGEHVSGKVKDQIEEMTMDIRLLKEDLTDAIKAMGHSMDILSEKIQAATQQQITSIPIRIVVLLFAIILMAFVGGAGLAALRHFYSVPL